jgi:mono/diheme cytochrome c family protein
VFLYLNSRGPKQQIFFEMKLFKRILKWTGIVLSLLIIALVLTVALRQNLKYDRPYPAITASRDSAVIARGKNIIFSTGHCMDCHSKRNNDSLMNAGAEIPLTGGVMFDLPVGKIYSRNITPDVETGIGKFSDGEIARALRYGVHPDGTAVFDFMAFHNTSDEDLTAIISYLRAQKPVHNEVPKHSLNVLGMIVKAFMVVPVGPTGEVAKSVKRDSTAAYGKYIAHYLANCNGCHTERNLAGEFTGESFAGGGEIDGYYPPNLTTSTESRINGWSQQDFINRFRMGRVIPKSPMPWNSFKRMTDDELKAVYKYLKTIKPAKTKEHEK